MDANEHARSVTRALARVPHAVDTPDARILASWERCLDHHGLEPHRVGRPPVMSAVELRERTAPLEPLLLAARGEVERLYARLADHDYVVILTDAQGVMVMYRCPEPLLADCSAAGVLPGSVWTEEHQGTNGIGLCLAERAPVSVVMGDHFAARLASVTCTVAPIFGTRGELAGVLNVTTPRDSSHAAERLVRGVVERAARRIENRCFEQRYADARVLRLSRHDDFLDVAAEARVAIDDAGRVIDATPSALALLGAAPGGVAGTPWPTLAGAGPHEAWAALEAAGRASIARAGAPPLYVRLAEASGARLAAAHGPAGRNARRAPAPPPAPAPLAAAGSTAHRAAGAAAPGLFTAYVPPPAAADAVLAEAAGADARVAERVRLAQRLLARGLPVLLQGETGSGKTRLARALHAAGPWRAGPFVAINCAAIPRELIESELFGYRPGAFTGAAREGARGRIAEADGGVLLLDEVGDMPLALQTRLLQVLSDGEVVPVGGGAPQRVRFALVSATLHDLAQRVREGAFREDLYHRLAGATIALPPLRARADLAALVERVFEEAAAAAQLPAPRLAPAALARLLHYRWPGNLRELHHVARYALAVAEGPVIEAHCLPEALQAPDASSAGAPADGIAAVGAPCAAGRTRAPEARAGASGPPEPARLAAALDRHGWNVSATAAALGVSRATLHRWLRAAGLARPSRLPG